MTFTDIALKNVLKKLRGYLGYFLSLVITVVIFQLFCSLYFNKAFEAYRFGTGKMTALFRAAAVAVLLFAFVFTMYSGTRFIRAQKKEIALYSLLGLRKSMIAGLMLAETGIIGILAVLTGILIGSLTAGRCAGLLLKIMATGTQADFAFDFRAALVTAAAFTALFGLNGFRAYRTIYDYTLIELMHASGRSEGPADYSPAGGVAGLALLGIGYGAAALMDLNAGGMSLLLPAFLVLLSVCLGTYLLFLNGVPMLISILKRRQACYYRTTNFISISQIAFRLSENAKLLSVTALLISVAITMVSASYSLYRGLGSDSIRFYAPYAYLVKNITEGQRQKALETVDELGEVRITQADRIELVKVQFSSPDYAVAGERNATALGAPVDAYLMGESLYLQIIAHTDTKPGSLASTKTDFVGGLQAADCYFLDGNMTAEYTKKLPGKEIRVSLNGDEGRFLVAGAGLHKYIGLMDLYQRPTVVVSDAVYASYCTKAGAEGVDVYDGFQFDDVMASKNTVDALNQIVPRRFSDGGIPANVSYIGFYAANFALYGAYVFIGFFIGVLFLAAVGSILYYKLSMEAEEEAPRYEILRKVGMTKREILRSVLKQLLLTYALPMGVGLVHTVFALLTYNRMLAEIAQETPTFLNAAMVALAFLAAYGAFYGLSAAEYFRIVWRRARGVAA